MSEYTTADKVRGGALALALSLLVAAALGTSGCRLIGGSRVSPVETPTTPAGITGEIKSIDRATAGDVWGTLLVEGGEQPDGAVSDKASVSITEKTLIARDGRWIPADDLKTGMTVRVWFEGPVAESYPVQGSASFIEVE